MLETVLLHGFLVSVSSIGLALNVLQKLMLRSRSLWQFDLAVCSRSHFTPLISYAVSTATCWHSTAKCSATVATVLWMPGPGSLAWKIKSDSPGLLYTVNSCCCVAVCDDLALALMPSIVIFLLCEHLFSSSQVPMPFHLLVEAINQQ